MINKEGLAMIVWTISKVEYARLKRRKIETVFTGGDIISDGSVALLRPVDKRLNPTARVAGVLSAGVHNQKKYLEHQFGAQEPVF